jgi:hypothetical protein
MGNELMRVSLQKTFHSQSTISDHIMNNIWTLYKTDREYLESFGICYWIKDGEDQLDLSCEVLHVVKEERSILNKIKGRESN